MSKSNNFHHGDLKRALYDAAVSLLDQHGSGGVTIRAVARAAGVSHSAPINHYKDKRALLTAIGQGEFKTILQNIETSLNKASSAPKDRIKVIANSIMDFGFKHPNRYQLLWRADLIDHEDPALLAVMDKVYDTLCFEIERAIPHANVDKDTVAVALWSMLHGYVDMCQSGMFTPLDDTVTDKPRRYAMLELFLAVLS